MLKLLFSILILFSYNFSFGGELSPRHAKKCQNMANVFKRHNFPKVYKIDDFLNECKILGMQALPEISSSNPGCSNYAQMIGDLDQSISLQEEISASCDRNDKEIKRLAEDIRSDLSFLPKACHNQPAMEKVHNVWSRYHNCDYNCAQRIDDWLAAARATRSNLAVASHRCGSQDKVPVDDTGGNWRILVPNTREFHNE